MVIFTVTSVGAPGIATGAVTVAVSSFVKAEQPEASQARMRMCSVAPAVALTATEAVNVEPSTVKVGGDGSGSPAATSAIALVEIQPLYAVIWPATTGVPSVF